MKLGLGHSYDDVQFLNKKVRGWIDLTKPASSVGIGLGYFVGSLYFFAYTNPSGWIDAVGSNLFNIMFVSATMFLAHSASQALNMAEDADMDRETPHKQNRPIPSGIVTEDEARMIAWILSGLAIWRALWVDKIFAGFVLVLLFFGIFYNLDPIRAKERIISVPWQAASRGLLTFPTIWAAYGNPWKPLPWALGVFLFFYVLGFQNSADFIDKPIDEEYGIQTFVVAFGIDGVIKIAYISVIAMFLSILLFIQLNVYPENLIILISFIPLCLLMIHYMKNKPDAVSETTGNHPSWLWYYAGMVLAVTLPLIAEVYI